MRGSLIRYFQPKSEVFTADTHKKNNFMDCEPNPRLWLRLYSHTDWFTTVHTSFLSSDLCRKVSSNCSLISRNQSCLVWSQHHQPRQSLRGKNQRLPCSLKCVLSFSGGIYSSESRTPSSCWVLARFSVRLPWTPIKLAPRVRHQNEGRWRCDPSFFFRFLGRFRPWSLVNVRVFCEAKIKEELSF